MRAINKLLLPALAVLAEGCSSPAPKVNMEGEKLLDVARTILTEIKQNCDTAMIDPSSQNVQGGGMRAAFSSTSHSEDISKATILGGVLTSKGYCECTHGGFAKMAPEEVLACHWSVKSGDKQVASSSFDLVGMAQPVPQGAIHDPYDGSTSYNDGRHLISAHSTDAYVDIEIHPLHEETSFIMGNDTVRHPVDREKAIDFRNQAITDLFEIRNHFRRDR